jgi:hypothetical protein
MKLSRIGILLIGILLCVTYSRAQTFDEWFQQNSTQKKYLLEQIAKLQIYLGYVKKGYDIVKKGLTIIGEIKNGDLNMHRLFFDDLKIVKSSVSNYSKTRETLSAISFIKEKIEKTKEFLSSTGFFIQSENKFINHQLDNVLTQLLEDATLLKEVLSNNALQMNDNERLKRIDKIFESVNSKKEWVNAAAFHCNVLAAQRSKSLHDLDFIRQLK